MVYWSENISKCPEDKYKMKPTLRYAVVRGTKEVSFKVYECPICRNSFIEYPGVEFAASADISLHYLSSSEREKVKAAREQKYIDQQAAWKAKQEQERLIKQRIEEQRQRELEANRVAEEKHRLEERRQREAAEEERRRKLLAEYTTDELFVSDEKLFIRATEILKELYGEQARFRPGQYEAIERTIKEKRLLVVQKTGWGKSLVYFVCTKLLREDGAGVTLVISPLLALMENQLVQARKMNLKCDVLNSTTTNRRVEILDDMASDKLDLVLATPESLNSKAVKNALPNIRIGLVVIDEAHCISDWGHDFRLEYSKIYRVIEQLQKNVPVLATTATANNAVIEDLKKQMGEPNISRGHLMRDNLSIQVLDLPEKENRYAWILDNLPRLPGTGIIYCLSRKDCIWLADFLRENGFAAEPYFSGNEEREQLSKEILEKFIKDEIKVIVSTIKLGMGFDKGNVPFVIHFHCPKNVIGYYQQIGRAGRNIPFARTFLMLGEEDFNINRGFIEKAFPEENDMRNIREYITKHPYCTINMICAAIDIQKKTIIKSLEFLEDGGFIDKGWRSINGRFYAVYNSTAVRFSYNGEHYNSIKRLRYQELQQMQDIAKTHNCLSRTVVSALDDIEDHDCGICSNCRPGSRFPTTVSERSKKIAKDYLEKITIPIDPWQYWPKNSIKEVASENEYPNLPGVALSIYNQGLGRLVYEGKYRTDKFDDILVQKGAKVLKKYIKEHKLAYITAIPSLNTVVVPNYAIRLAAACGLPYVTLLRKTNRKHQKVLNNTSHQFENAYKSFEVLPNVNIPESVILVDDIVDSGLTLAVCGALLRKNGCERVFPLALADAGSGGRDDEDE